MEIQIYSKNGEKRLKITSIEYNGEWMGECYVLFDVETPEPIEFEIGDWLEYRSERFELHYIPEVTMQAMPLTYGAAYRYEKVKFVSLAEELVNCDFLDYVLSDNNLHFSGLPDFSFYADSVKDLADRIQANMDRFCEQNNLPYWEVVVSENCVGNTKINIAVTNISCYDALSLAQSEFNVNFIIRGRKILIGTDGVPAAHLFKMGKDFAGNINGLYEFSRQADTDQKIVTRLRAYGSDRNLPRRYYNSLTDADGKKLVPDNMAVNRLMLPDFPQKTLDPYLDSDNISQLGVIEDTVTFDGNDGLEEIYPSLENATSEELKAAGYNTTATGRLDEIVEAEQIEDNGEGTEEGEQIIPDQETFTIRIKDLGFDIMDYLSDETPQISFKNGMLGGREFEILTGQHKPVQNADKTWTLTLNRVYDDAIGLFFPYRFYNAQPGDQFVLTGIYMPDIYIKMSSQRLLEAAKNYLANNDYARSIYTPRVDEIFMAQQHQKFLKGQAPQSLHLTLKEGDLLTFEEESLHLAASSIFIDKLTIKEGSGPVPTYEITLKEEKTVGALQRIQNQIDSIKSGLNSGGGGGGYNTEQLKQIIKAIGSSLFLSKITNDATAYNITVGGLLTTIFGLVVGTYRQGETGAWISRTGSAEFEDIFSRKEAWLLSGALFGDYIKNQLGGTVTADGFAEFRELFVREASSFRGPLSTPDFVQGFLDGIGWSIFDTDGEWTLEIDNLTVRNTMRIFEMIVSQMVGENDNRVFTSSLKVDHYDPETGIVWLDTQGGTFYNPFRKDDYVEIQRYNGQPSPDNAYYLTKHYEFIVTETGIGDLALGENRLDWIKFKDFSTRMEEGTPESLIVKGDTLVRTDNDSDPARKGILQIMAVGDNTPYLDVNYGLKTDPDNALKVRLGNLSGIRHHLFGWLDGWGLYSENAYLVGDFRLARTGDSIDTQIEMLKSQFASRYSETTYDIAEADNYLFNPSFTNNMEGWKAEANTTSVIYAGDYEAMLINGNIFIADGGDTRIAEISDYEGKAMLHIFNSGVRQNNETIQAKIKEYGLELTHRVYNTASAEYSDWNDSLTGELEDSYTEVPETLYLAIKFLALTDGTLTVGMLGSNATEGSLPDTKTTYQIRKGNDWQMMEWAGTWDGKGDFVLEFSGEMYVAMLSLTSDPLNSYKSEIGTLIKQTAKNIELIGYNIDAKARRMTDLGLEINAVDAYIKAYVETTDQALGEIRGTQLKLTSELAELKAYTETEIGDLKESGLKISSDVAELYSWKEEIDETTGTLKSSVAALQVSAEEIRSSVTELEDGLATANSTIIQTADQIRSEVTDIQNGLQSQITQNAANIELKVGMNDGEKMITAINLSQEGVKIQADKVEIAGNFTVNDFFQITTDGHIDIYGVMRSASDYITNERYWDSYNTAEIICISDGTKGLMKTLRGHRDAIGSSIKVSNQNALGSDVMATIDAPVFTYRDSDGAASISGVIRYTLGPQESMEFTCFRTGPNAAEWIATGSMRYQMFRRSNMGNIYGRFPVCHAMGKLKLNRDSAVTGTQSPNTAVMVDGYMYDGVHLTNLFMAVRKDMGVYEITFEEGTLPASYVIIVTPKVGYYYRNNNWETMSVYVYAEQQTSTKIELRGHAQDNLLVDFECDIMILDNQNWYY